MIDRLANTKDYLEWLAQQHGDVSCDKCDEVSYAELAKMSEATRAAYAPFSNRNGAVRRCLVCSQHFPYAWARDLYPHKVLEFVDSHSDVVPVEAIRVACQNG